MRWFWNGGTNYISVKFIIFFKLDIVQPKLNDKFPTYLTQARRCFWNVETKYISAKFIIFFKLGIVQPKLNNKFPTYLTQAALEQVTILIYFTSFLYKTFGNNGHPSSLELKLGP